MFPEISVVMANYNGESYLADALRSLQNQTFSDWELLFVDDASSDDSVGLASRFAVHDPRIQIISAEKNRGPGAARNKAIDLAKGRWIAIFDSDDIMRPARLEALRQRSIRDNAPVVVDDLLVFSDDPANARRFLPRHLTRAPRSIELANFIDSGRFSSQKADLGYLKPFIALDFLRRSGIRYNEKLRIGEDSDLIVRLLAPGISLRLEPEAHYMYRKHPNSISHRIQRDAILALIEANSGLIEMMPRHRTDAVAALTRRQTSLLSMLLYDETIRMIKAGNYGQATMVGLTTPRIWPLLTRPPLARLARFLNRNKRPTLVAAMPSLLAEQTETQTNRQQVPIKHSIADRSRLERRKAVKAPTAKPLPLGITQPSVQEGFALTKRAIGKRSQIVWGEHCTECAFPSCYSTCSFYTPGQDLHCRRFEHGIEHLDGPTSKLTRIQFRRWGKLEGEGRVALKSSGAAAGMQVLDRLYDRLSRFRHLGRRLNWRWGKFKRYVGGIGDVVSGADVFVLEAFHDDEAVWPFTFTIMPQGKDKPGLFQYRVNLACGYNRIVIPVSDISTKVDLDQALVFQIEPLKEKTPPIIFGVTDFVRLTQPLENVVGHANAKLPQPDYEGGKPKFKCVVWDLDGTLWQGILAEDGIDGIHLSPTAAQLVRELDRRGIINSIASKNDPELAMAALEKFGLSDYFVFPKISWAPKSEGVRAIIAEMNVGADTFAFVDDQSFERGEVSEVLPEVSVFSDTEMAKLLDNPRFDVPITAESNARREMYRMEERRNKARAASAIDYTEFLRACRIRLEINRLSVSNLDRVYELSQRTNQLNFSGTRYSRTDLAQLMENASMDTFVLTCNDKFGDYGIIGFAVLDKEKAMIESFFMSCRVQRKKVENAFFNFVAKEVNSRGKEFLRVRYRKTPKNGASVQLLEDLGFNYSSADEGGGSLSIDLPRHFPDDEVVDIVLIETEPRQAVA